MKWSESQVSRLRSLCYQGVSNKEIAADIGCSLNDVYAKRSQLGITISKCKGAEGINRAERESEPAQEQVRLKHLNEMKAALSEILDEWGAKYGYILGPEIVTGAKKDIRPEGTE